MRVILQFFAILLCAYLGIASYLYINQRAYIYFPNTAALDIAAANHQGFRAVFSKTEDGLTLQHWFSLPELGQPTLIYFHGNSGNLSHRLAYVKEYQQAGWGVLLVGYRGYGDNPGRPDEQGFYKDARSALALLKAAGVPDNQRIFFGASLGSGVAVQMATESKPIKALVLQSPFDSLVGIAKLMYPIFPVDLLLHDKFDNLSKIASLHMPLLIIATKNDKVVPFKLTQKVFDKANQPKTLELLPGRTHNNLSSPAMRKKVIGFINGLA